MNGYAPNVLRVNLSTKGIKKEPVSEGLVQEYIGGRGFIARILYDELKPGTAPLSAENKVVIAPGAMSGTFLPGSGKVHFGTKSPATGGYGDSNMGGHFGPELRYAGYEMVIIDGAGAEPCYLFIDDDKVELRPAGHLWGKGALQAEKMLKEELGEEFQIATIGPAGENLVKYACISHDFGRQAGRTGIAAVMGYKKLKAVAVRGTKGIKLAEPVKVLAKAMEMYALCAKSPITPDWIRYGTAGVTDWANSIGAFPTKNFQAGYYDGHKNINGESLRSRIHLTDKGCFGCPSPCGKYARTTVKQGEAYVEGPEYETIALIGGNCMLKSIEDVAYANYIADELGIDTISGGNVLAFAMECFEKGIINRDDVGRDIAFGDLDSAVFLLGAIAYRQGIGDVLAEGVRHAAAVFGKGSEAFAIQVKGLEWSGYESRYAPSMMLSYMTADIGAHHNRAWAITHDIKVGREGIEGKEARVIELQHIRPLFDMLGLCRLQWVELGLELEHYAEIFAMVTGVERSLADLLLASERVWNLTRVFNIREIPGFGRKDDYPPRRFMEEPLVEGEGKGRFIPRQDIDRLLDAYYARRGWDSNGHPTRTKLEALGLASEARAFGA